MNKIITNLYCERCGEVCSIYTYLDHYNKFNGEKCYISQYHCPKIKKEDLYSFNSDGTYMGHSVYIQKKF